MTHTLFLPLGALSMSFWSAAYATGRVTSADLTETMTRIADFAAVKGFEIATTLLDNAAVFTAF